MSVCAGEPQDLFFAFRRFDVEIDRKLASLRTAPQSLVAVFVSDMRAHGLSPDDAARVESLLACLLGLDFDRVYPNYLTHPLRVAASLVRVRGRAVYDEVALALCHNVREAGLADLGGAASRFLSEAMTEAIARLTIDRGCERDEAYVETYYDAIERAGEPLVLLKALDKLDNALWWVCFDVEAWDVEVVTRQVCPRVSRRHPVLSAYLERLARHATNPETRGRFAERCAS